MRRLAENDLKTWFDSNDRMPLIVRGARQVGKSTLVQLFCENEKIDLITVNLEKIKLHSVEQEKFSMDEVLDEIQISFKKEIHSRSLIFFDEIQEQPKLLKYLRYFYEERKNLAVIAAGSLLEVALRSEEFSFPVGRVSFYHLGPFTFKEFLIATGHEKLSDKIDRLEFTAAVIATAKDELRKYYYTGGMPKCILTYIESGSLVRVRDIQENILQSYMADIPKYNSRLKTDKIQRVLSACLTQMGEKIIYQRLDPDSQARDIKRIIELLVDIRLLMPCYHSDANSSPLFGEVDLGIQKLYFLDIGLLNCLLRLDFQMIDVEMKNQFNSKGFLAEQFVAQHLAYADGPAKPPRLFYWLKDKGIQKGEIDFLIQRSIKIIPAEVKSKASGHLKSLFYFMRAKKQNQVAIKFSMEDFDDKYVQHKIDQDIVSFRLLTIPHYVIQSLDKIMKSVS